MDGIINVNKEAGYTSHDVVACLRKIFNMKKIGHTGTLDPDATGVLPVCLGKATKVCDLITNKDKSYTVKAKLGIKTDTLDLSGEVLETDDKYVFNEKEIEKEVSFFLGNIKQVPPMYSAIKINGKKLYEYAREGKEVKRKERDVTISEIKTYDFNSEEKTFYMDVTCSKGTYIRTLCDDVGKRLGTFCSMEKLVRTRSGLFELKDAHTLDEIRAFVEADEASKILYSTDYVFGSYEKIDISSDSEDLCKMILNGNKVSSKGFEDVKDGNVRIYVDGNFCAVYEKAGKILKPVKMFLG